MTPFCIQCQICHHAQSNAITRLPFFRCPVFTSVTQLNANWNHGQVRCDNGSLYLFSSDGEAITTIAPCLSINRFDAESFKLLFSAFSLKYFLLCSFFPFARFLSTNHIKVMRKTSSGMIFVNSYFTIVSSVRLFAHVLSQSQWSSALNFIHYITSAHFYWHIK